MQGRRDIGTQGQRHGGGIGLQPVRWFAIATISLAFAAPTRAIDVSVETWAGELHRGQWTGVADGSVRIETGGGVRTLALAELMRATFEVGASTDTAPRVATIYLADGTVLFGRIVGASGDAIDAECRWAGRVTLPLKQLAAVCFKPDAARSPQSQAFGELLADRPADRDVLIAAAGESAKTARGVLESLTEKSIAFHWNDQTLTVSHERCYAIVLARGVDRPAPAPATVRLRDDTALAGDLNGGDNESLVMRAPFAERIELPLREVSSVAWHSESVTFAASLAPARYDFTPYVFGDWPWRANRSAMNTPIRLDGRTHERGIGMRCGGTLAFATGGEYGLFAATIGIDDAVRPRGEVIFRVLADEHEVFNSGPVTGLEAARRISADIGGAKRVTLVVDVGGRTDVGGCADWADARFIRGATQ